MQVHRKHPETYSEVNNIIFQDELNNNLVRSNARYRVPHGNHGNHVNNTITVEVCQDIDSNDLPA